MSLFRKIFGKKTDDPNQKIDDDGRSKYMPDIELPIDERFTIQFKANGGTCFIVSSRCTENYGRAPFGKDRTPSIYLQ